MKILHGKSSFHNRHHYSPMLVLIRRLIIDTRMVWRRLRAVLPRRRVPVSAPIAHAPRTIKDICSKIVPVYREEFNFARECISVSCVRAMLMSIETGGGIVGKRVAFSDGEDLCTICSSNTYNLPFSSAL